MNKSYLDYINYHLYNPSVQCSCNIVVSDNYFIDCLAIVFVASIIPHLANVNITDRAGRTSLHHAAFNGHREVCVFQLNNCFLLQVARVI